MVEGSQKHVFYFKQGASVSSKCGVIGFQDLYTCSMIICICKIQIMYVFMNKLFDLYDFFCS